MGQAMVIYVCISSPPRLTSEVSVNPVHNGPRYKNDNCSETKARSGRAWIVGRWAFKNDLVLWK